MQVALQLRSGLGNDGILGYHRKRQGELWLAYEWILCRLVLWHPGNRDNLRRTMADQYAASAKGSKSDRESEWKFHDRFSVSASYSPGVHDNDGNGIDYIQCSIRVNS